MINVLQNILFRDFWLKLFSLVLAILIWLIVWSFAIRQDVPPTAGLGLVRPEISTETFPNIPVLVVSAAADVRDFKVSPSVVTVTVRGEPKELAALEARLQTDPQSSDIRAIVDLTDIETARSTKRKIVVTVPPDITFVSAEPESVDVLVPPKAGAKSAANTYGLLNR